VDDIDILLGKLYRLRATVAQVISDDAAVLFNVPDRAASRKERERTLLKALKLGIVRLRADGVGHSQKEAKDADPASLEVSDLSPNLRVELTSKGAKLWEKKAAPSWDYFIDEADPRPVRGNVWIFLEAKSRPWLTHVDETLKALGFFAENERRITVLHDWQALYWKKLSLGYSLGIDTGFAAESERGARFLQGLTVGDGRLGDTISVLSAIWDAKWIGSLR
jgi:hypothetical protein